MAQGVGAAPRPGPAAVARRSGTALRARSTAAVRQSWRSRPGPQRRHAAVAAATTRRSLISHRCAPRLAAARSSSSPADAQDPPLLRPGGRAGAPPRARAAPAARAVARCGRACGRSAAGARAAPAGWRGPRGGDVGAMWRGPRGGDAPASATGRGGACGAAGRGESGVGPTDARGMGGSYSWGLGSGIWRPMQNKSQFKRLAGVHFLSKFLKI